jgi:nitroreductase
LATHIELADLEALLQARRSVRVYQHQPVPRELLERIMETARHAPSACFSECCQFVVLHDAERRRQFVDRLMRRAALMTPLLRLGWLAKPILWLTGCPVRDAGDPRVVRGLFAGVDRWRETGVGFFHNAPVIVIVHTTPDGVQPKECACYAAYHIVLAAQAAGLGSCIIGYAPPILNKMRRHKRDLGIAPRNTVQVVLTLGYPAETFYALPPRAPLSCAWL